MDEQEPDTWLARAIARRLAEQEQKTTGSARFNSSI